MGWPILELAVLEPGWLKAAARADGRAGAAVRRCQTGHPAATSPRIAAHGHQETSPAGLPRSPLRTPGPFPTRVIPKLRARAPTHTHTHHTTTTTHTHAQNSLPNTQQESPPPSPTHAEAQVGQHRHADQPPHHGGDGAQVGGAAARDLSSAGGGGGSGGQVAVGWRVRSGSIPANHSLLGPKPPIQQLAQRLPRASQRGPPSPPTHTRACPPCPCPHRSARNGAWGRCTAGSGSRRASRQTASRRSRSGGGGGGGKLGGGGPGGGLGGGGPQGEGGRGGAGGRGGR
jgi:translation initiation factor IF-2